MTKKRTFIFQVDPSFSKVFADDVHPEITFDYTYIGEILEGPKKDKVLYECDRRACHEKCSLPCRHTTDITHAKNFECDNGIWIERISYPEAEV